MEHFPLHNFRQKGYLIKEWKKTAKSALLSEYEKAIS